MRGNYIHRMTKQREVIMDELRKSKLHPTADDILLLARRSLPNISLATVYRNLDILVKSGKIRKIDAGQGKACYDGDMTEHFHLRCVKCGSIRDIIDRNFIPNHSKSLRDIDFEKK